MRIGLLGSRGIPACYSGFETFYENLAVRLVQRGHDVTVYNRKQYVNYPLEYYKGVRLVTFPTIRSKQLDTLFHTFISVIHAAFQRYDIAYFCIVGNSPLTILTRMFGMKTILNVDGEDWKREKWHGLEKVYLKLSERIATVFPHVVISDSKVIRKRYHQDYKTETVFIPYGANTAKSSDTTYLNKFGLEKEKYILFVGRLVPENNAHLLIEGFIQLKSDYKLVIIGNAPYVESYKEELKRMAGQNVTFTGYLFGEGYASLSSHCYLFVLPSGVDGTRPVLLDQMGFGNCVLVNNSSANLEVIGNAGISFNGKDGFSDLMSKLEYLFSHPEIVVEYRKRAVDRVMKHYSWDVVTEKYEQLFKTLLKGKGPHMVAPFEVY
jgi:glycosyltransferase involved in cell wall biosynthesis